MDPFWNNLVLFGIALIGAYTAYESRVARAAAVESLDVSKKTELNTNSMKDALVKAVGDAQHAAGKEEGRTEGAEKAAILAQGKLISLPPHKPIP